MPQICSAMQADPSGRSARPLSCPPLVMECWQHFTEGVTWKLQSLHGAMMAAAQRTCDQQHVCEQGHPAPQPPPNHKVQDVGDERHRCEEVTKKAGALVALPPDCQYICAKDTSSSSQQLPCPNKLFSLMVHAALPLSYPCIAADAIMQAAASA